MLLITGGHFYTDKKGIITKMFSWIKVYYKKLMHRNVTFSNVYEH